MEPLHRMGLILGLAVIGLALCTSSAEADRGRASGSCNAYGCWSPGGGCNAYGCWERGGGCNAYGCWERGGSCNPYGCTNHGECNAYGCPKAPRTWRGRAGDRRPARSLRQKRRWIEASVGRDLGAVAINPFTRQWGWAVRRASVSAARSAADRHCGVDCSVHIVFEDCAAIARGNGGIYGWSRAWSRSEAEERALAQCHQRGTGCAVAVWACN